MARTFFISDCHLDEKRPQIIELFVRFTQEHAPSADALYILGDLFDYWVGDDALPEKLEPVIDCLHTAAKNIPVYFIHGNRDFLVGKQFAKDSGCRLLDQLNVIDLYGQRTLLMHGDLLCTDDLAYQRYRAVIRNRFLCNTFSRLPLGVRLAITRHLRNTSRQAIESKRPEIMDANEDTVVDYMRKFEVAQIIHGHTHRPAIHTTTVNGEKCRRIVLGDWYETGSYLVMENGVAELKTL